MGYTKLFSSILDSTIWIEPAATRLVWITLLAMADRDGVVEASVPGLANRARVDRSECERALALLLSPDPDSRTPDHEGRRIEVVAGGWKIINYDEYRRRLSAEEQREKTAERQRRYQARLRHARHGVSREITNITANHKNNDIAEAKAEAEAERESVKNTLSLRASARESLSVDAALAERAGRFLKRYQELYRELRHGARVRIKPALDHYRAVDLCRVWDDARLEKLAKVFLKTDDEWIAGTGRDFGVFASRATWCDDRLAAVEKERRS